MLLLLQRVTRACVEVDGATVGAHALVDRDVAPSATVLAPRARLAGGPAGE